MPGTDDASSSHRAPAPSQLEEDQVVGFSPSINIQNPYAALPESAAAPLHLSSGQTPPAVPMTADSRAHRPPSNGFSFTAPQLGETIFCAPASGLEPLFDLAGEDEDLLNLGNAGSSPVPQLDGFDYLYDRRGKCSSSRNW